MLEQSTPPATTAPGDIGREHFPSTPDEEETGETLYFALQNANQAFRRGDLNRVAEELEKAATLAPNNTVLKVSLGEIYNRLDRPDDAIEAAKQVLRLVPESAQAYDIMGVAYMKQGKPEKAIKAFQTVIARAPDVAIGDAHLGDAYFRLGNRTEALKHLDRALKIDPRRLDALLKSAVILQQVGRSQEARRRAEAALEINPKEAFAYSIIGNAQREEGRIDEAEQSYRKAISLRPDFSYFRVLLGELYVGKGNADGAIDAYREILAREPEDLGAHTRLAELYKSTKQEALAAYHTGIVAFGQGRIREAIDAYAAAVNRDPTLDGAYVKLAVAYLRESEWARAEEAVGKALDLDGNNAVALSLLGDILRTQNKTAEALDAYRKAIAFDQTQAATYMKLADLLKHEKRCGEALGYYKIASQLASQTAGAALIAMGDCLQTLGQPDQAIDHYREAVARDPTNARAFNSLAWLYALRGENLEQALTLAERAASLAPSNPAIIDTLGWLYFLNGHHEVAEKNLWIAAYALPREPTVLYHLGAVLLKRGKRLEAVDVLKQALSSNREFPEAEETRALLEGLR